MRNFIRKLFVWVGVGIVCIVPVTFFACTFFIVGKMVTLGRDWYEIVFFCFIALAIALVIADSSRNKVQ